VKKPERQGIRRSRYHRIEVHEDQRCSGIGRNVLITSRLGLSVRSSPECSGFPGARSLDGVGTAWRGKRGPACATKTQYIQSTRANEREDTNNTRLGPPTKLKDQRRQGGGDRTRNSGGGRSHGPGVTFPFAIALTSVDAAVQIRNWHAESPVANCFRPRLQGTAIYNSVRALPFNK